jgi:hypothetical protein
MFSDEAVGDRDMGWRDKLAEGLLLDCLCVRGVQLTGMILLSLFSVCCGYAAMPATNALAAPSNLGRRYVATIL